MNLFFIAFIQLACPLVLLFIKPKAGIYHMALCLNFLFFYQKKSFKTLIIWLLKLFVSVHANHWFFYKQLDFCIDDIYWKYCIRSCLHVLNVREPRYIPYGIVIICKINCWLNCYNLQLHYKYLLARLINQRDNEWILLPESHHWLFE